MVINRQGQLVVRAPGRVGVSEIERFILQKQAWIVKHQQKLLSNPSPIKQYIEGEKFLFLGQEYPLRLVNGRGKAVVLYDKEFLLPAVLAGKAKRLFEQWYKKQAQDLLPKRAAVFGPRMQVNYRAIKISSAKTRWGSCSASGNITFSWRLITAPLEAVDYVVVHELAHLVHRNHSRQFWALVEKFCPHYKAIRKNLNSRAKF